MPDSIPCETFPQSNAKKEILAAPLDDKVVNLQSEQRAKRIASVDG